MPLTAISGGSQTTKVIGSISTGLFPQPLHPDVASYVAAQSANGYNASRVRVDALNNLVWGFIGNGIYDKCQVIYPFLGGTTVNAQKWNLKNVADTDAAFRLAFFGSYTLADTGFKINAANTANYARTYYTPSVNATSNDGHLSVYIRDVYTGTGCPIGGRGGNQATSNAYQIFASTGLSIGTIQAENTNNGISYGTSGSAGFYSANRSASNSAQAYYNGVLRGTNTNTSLSTATAVGEITLALATNGSIAGRQWPTTSEIAFATIGQSLTGVQQRNFYIIVQAYQTALGRQV